MRRGAVGQSDRRPVRIWNVSSHWRLAAPVLASVLAGCAAPLGAVGDDQPTTVLDQVSWPVKTARLELRRAKLSDAAAVWQYRRLETVSRWLGNQPGDLDDYIVEFARRLPMTLLVVRTSDAAVIGDLMLRIEDGWAQREVGDQARNVQAELGWVLGPEFVGAGYATEAVHALIDLSFTDLGLRRVVAGCFAANDSSWRLMERLGMRRESHTRQDLLHRDLGWQDGYTYALLSEEWVQADLAQP